MFSRGQLVQTTGGPAPAGRESLTEPEIRDILRRLHEAHREVGAMIETLDGLADVLRGGTGAPPPPPERPGLRRRLA
jgi:hypothetical protein